MQVTVDSLGVLEAAEPTNKLLSCFNVVNYVTLKCCCKLRQALGSRSRPSNSINRECELASSVLFGVKLAYSYQREAVIRGPTPQDTAEVAAFQALWGCENRKLRRFKDGTVCYAVTFAEITDSHMQLRKVCGAIAKLVVCEHLRRRGHVLSTCEVSSMFDTVMINASLWPPFKEYGVRSLYLEKISFKADTSLNPRKNTSTMKIPQTFTENQ